MRGTSARSCACVRACVRVHVHARSIDSLLHGAYARGDAYAGRRTPKRAKLLPVLPTRGVAPPRTEMDSGSKDRGIRGDRGIAGTAMGKGEADVCVSPRGEEGRGGGRGERGGGGEETLRASNGERTGVGCPHEGEIKRRKRGRWN